MFLDAVSVPYANILLVPLESKESNIAIATIVPWSPPDAALNVMFEVFVIDPEDADPILLSILILA